MEGMVGFLILVLVAALIYSRFKQKKDGVGVSGTAGGAPGSGELVCPHCGTVAKPKMKTKGSILIELILWICLIIPGLIYSIWRHSSRYVSTVKKT